MDRAIWLGPLLGFTNRIPKMKVSHGHTKAILL